MKKNTFKTEHFDHCFIQGDKITIHKSVIERAIKYVKRSADIYGDAGFDSGEIHILEEMVDVINREEK